jgi:bifunctional NMN adenylyltransferase/nudix hydrolase
MEQAVKREVHEEISGIEIGEPKYIGTHKIDDWRYRGKSDGIMTTFFLVRYLWGSPIAKDDLHECKSFELKSLRPEIMVVEHRPLLTLLFAYLERELKL